MNSVCLRSRTEFLNKDTDPLISSSIVSTENKTRIFRQQYISYNFYHLTSRVYGERPTLPSLRQEVCTTYDACRPAMHVNIHLLTVLNGEYFHPTIHVYSWFAPTWHGGHVGGQCNSPFSHSSHGTVKLCVLARLFAAYLLSCQWGYERNLFSLDEPSLS